MTFRHRAGVRPYTSPCGFAESCVFVKQLPPPGLCPSPPLASRGGLLLPKLRRQIAEFLQRHSLKRLGMLYQSTCVGFGYGLMRGLFPGTPSRPLQSDKEEQHTASVTTRWPTIVRVVPIDYAFRPRLRGRLTLRRLTLRRNPWTFGDAVFHSVCRYSCQHSHFRCLQDASRLSLRGPTERSATACTRVQTQSFGSRLEPRYIFGAGPLS